MCVFRRPLTLILAGSFVGCPGTTKTDTAPPADSQTDSDEETDTDTDTDSDTDADADADADADTDCDTDMTTVPPTFPLSCADASLRGEEEDAGTGAIVAAGGDVDGDGVGDLLIMNDVDHRGATLVSGKVRGDVHLTDVGATFDFGDRYMYGVSGVIPGDTSGDGLADVLIGGHYDDVALVLGPVADGTAVPEDAYMEIHRVGGPTDNGFGDVIAAAGDANGDGKADMLLDAVDAVWILSQVLPGTWEVEDVSSDVLIPQIYEGNWCREGTYSREGESVGVGDMDGDGFQDFAVSESAWSPTPEIGVCNAGIVWLAYGPVSGSVDLATEAVSLQGDTRGKYEGDVVGESIAAAGDVNGDGYADLIASGSGGMYLVHGPAIASGAIVTSGIFFDTRQGEPDVDGAGDVDGDGFDDLMVEGYGTYGDRVYFFHGPVTGTQAVEDSFVMIERDHGAFSRIRTQAPAGDLDGDGKDDLIVTDPRWADDTGSAYLVLGWRL